MVAAVAEEEAAAAAALEPMGCNESIHRAGWTRACLISLRVLYDAPASSCGVMAMILFYAAAEGEPLVGVESVKLWKIHRRLCAE